jgi:hypothetical protein
MLRRLCDLRLCLVSVATHVRRSFPLLSVWLGQLKDGRSYLHERKNDWRRRSADGLGVVAARRDYS